jgi:hypothetical protein
MYGCSLVAISSLVSFWGREKRQKNKEERQKHTRVDTDRWQFRDDGRPCFTKTFSKEISGMGGGVGTFTKTHTCVSCLACKSESSPGTATSLSPGSTRQRCQVKPSGDPVVQHARPFSPPFPLALPTHIAPDDVGIWSCTGFHMG